MTDTGQLPGEGLPENAGVVEQQPGNPGPGAYTFLEPSEHPPEEDDLLLMPGAQGAWSDPSQALQQPAHTLQAVGVAQAQHPGTPQVPEQYTPAPPIPPQLQVQVRGVSTPPAPARSTGAQSGGPGVSPQTPMGPEFAAPADLGAPEPTPAPDAAPVQAFVADAGAQAPSGPTDLGAPDSVAPLPGAQQPAQTAPQPNESAAQGDEAQVAQSDEAPEAGGGPSAADQPVQPEPVQSDSQNAAGPAADAPATPAEAEPTAPVQQAPVPSGMTPPAAPRPLHMGPPMPLDSSTGVVRSLADRGPAETPPHPLTVQNLTVGPASTGPEYLDVPVLPEPQLGEIPPQAGEPWDPQPPQSEPAAAVAAETVAPEPAVEVESPAAVAPEAEPEVASGPEVAPEPEAAAGQGIESGPEAEPAPAAVDGQPDAGPADSVEEAVQHSEPVEQTAEGPVAAEAAEAVTGDESVGGAAEAAPEVAAAPDTATTPEPPVVAVAPEAPTADPVPLPEATETDTALAEATGPEATGPDAVPASETVTALEPAADDAGAAVATASEPEAPQPAGEPQPAIDDLATAGESEPVHPEPARIEPAPEVLTAEEAAPADGTAPVAQAEGEVEAAAPDEAAEPAPVVEPHQVAAPAQETTSAPVPVEPPPPAAAAPPRPSPEADATPEAAPAEPRTQPDPEAAPEPQPATDSTPGPATEPEPIAATQAAPDGPAVEPQAAPAAQEPKNPPAPGYDDAEREAVLRVMRDRRDVRNGFRSDPIPHEVLIRVLEAAHTAPSVGHSQPWDFVVIRSAETRGAMHELAQRQRDTYAKSLPKGRAKQFKELKIEAILETPVNIVVTADPTRGGRHTLGRHSQPQMAPYSSALAVENLWLAARAEGLGVGWVSFFDEREMVRTLGLPEHLEVVAYLCVGYVDEFPEEPELMQSGWSKRRPLSWVVHEETYGRRALPGEEPKNLLQETVTSIRPLDAKALGEAWERQKRMTKPAGALGMLEIISAQLSGLSRMCPPPIPEPAALAVFAGDHGVHAQGVTAWPQEVTGQMVANFLGGGAVCNAFANQVGAEVCVIDVGVASDLPTTPGLLPRKVRAGTADFTAGPALTREEVFAAIEVGIETARDLVAAGNKALITGEMGIANTTVSAALICVYTGLDPAEVTGRGTGINDEMHARKVDVVRRGLELHEPDPADPIGVLAAVGGLEHAALVGLILGGASLRTPVLLDGVSAGAAALLARAIAPEALAACIAGHRSAEPGHVAALNKLGLRPLVDLDLRLGEGTGALLALPVVQSAARAMHEVATFDSAGVTEKQ